MAIDPMSLNSPADFSEISAPLGIGSTWASISDELAGGSVAPRERLYERAEFDPRELVGNVKRAFSTLEQDLVGFGPLLVQCVYALLTRENLLIFSPAGTAKTLFATLFFSRISGARVFDTQLSKGTLAEELFGSVDTEMLKRGRVVHNTRGTLVDADLAFIDEFFDANDMVLRAVGDIQRTEVQEGLATGNLTSAHGNCGRQLCPRHRGHRGGGRSLSLPRVHRSRLQPLRPDGDRTGRSPGITGGSNRRRTTSGSRWSISLTWPPSCGDWCRAGRSPRRRTFCSLRTSCSIATRSSANANPDLAKKRPLYISPRTYAKARLVLNAAALLGGRTGVTTEDLSQLKYAATTIGGAEEEARCFDKALTETLLRIRGADLEHIEAIVAAQELAEQVMARVRDGERIPCTGFVQRILRFFGLLSEGDVTFDHLRSFVESIQPSDDSVRQLKLGVIRRIQELTRRIDHRESELLN